MGYVVTDLFCFGMIDVKSREINIVLDTEEA